MCKIKIDLICVNIIICVLACSPNVSNIDANNLEFPKNEDSGKLDLENHFKQYLLSKNLFDMIIESFPSAIECQDILKKEFAEKYYSWITDLKNKIRLGEYKLSSLGTISYTRTLEEDSVQRDSIDKGTKTFIDISLNESNTSTFKDDWKKYYEENRRIVFLSYISDRSDEGFDFPGFFFYNGRWIYFPKPPRRIFK